MPKEPKRRRRRRLAANKLRANEPVPRADPTEAEVAGLAAERRDTADLARIRLAIDALASAVAAGGDGVAEDLAFHRSIADAAHNDVLRVQLISLQHVAWPQRNSTLTRDVAEHILALHRELYVLIKARDGDGARDLMSRHLRQIKARRVSEDRVSEDRVSEDTASENQDNNQPACC